MSIQDALTSILLLLVSYVPRVFRWTYYAINITLIKFLVAFNAHMWLILTCWGICLHFRAPLLSNSPTIFNTHVLITTNTPPLCQTCCTCFDLQTVDTLARSFYMHAVLRSTDLQLKKYTLVHVYFFNVYFFNSILP